MTFTAARNLRRFFISVMMSLLQALFSKNGAKNPQNQQGGATVSDDIAARVIIIVSQVLDVVAADIELEHAFVEDLDAESIQSVELMAAFEEEFNIEIDEDRAMAVKTVGAAVDFIKQCIREQRQ